MNSVYTISAPNSLHTILKGKSVTSSIGASKRPGQTSTGPILSLFIFFYREARPPPYFSVE